MTVPTKANDLAWSPTERGERRTPLPGGPATTIPPTLCTGCFTELQATASVQVHYVTVGYRWEHVANVDVAPEDLHRPQPAADQDTLIVLVRAAVADRQESA